MQEQIIKLLKQVIKEEFKIENIDLKLGTPPKNMF
jgi:uncharacterized Fe-S cluster-containing protein